MKYCPITYDEINDKKTYSSRGLKLLSPQLKKLDPLLLDAAEQRENALANVGKMSIQGMQPKLSAQLKIKEGRLEPVENHGHYILKPPSDSYPELPANEALTMSLAETIGIEVPLHGLIYGKDHSLTYFIKRFDRKGHKDKIAVEDFAQLSQESRDTKYKSSMEKIIQVITEFCSFPKIEYVKFFKLTLFNFLIGNEDMHLKNFTLITQDQKIMLSPAYDLLNTTIALKNPKEELALPLNGKKNNLRKKDLIDYLGKEKLGLNSLVIENVLIEIKKALPLWDNLIKKSFLSQKMQRKYSELLHERLARIGLMD